MLSANAILVDPLVTLNSGLGDIEAGEKSGDFTEVQSGSTVVASTPKIYSSEGAASRTYGQRVITLVTKLCVWLKSIPRPGLNLKRKDLRIDGAMGVTVVPKLEDFPEGFPRLACFLDSDESFMVYRRFGIVFSRLLLNKQDEIRMLEAQLLAMDRTDVANGNAKYLKKRDQRTFDTLPLGWTETRPQILASLEAKILEYSKLLLKANQVKSLEKPSPRDYRSVLRYMEKDGGQLYERDMSWIYDREDLVTLRPGREHAWLDGILERMLSLCRGRVVKETEARTDDEAIHYYDRRRVSKCVTMLLTAFILLLLMVPIGLLFHTAVQHNISRTTDTVVLILAFTLIFSAALSAFTKAKRHEIVAASAG
ncbi:hypothetical protein G7Y79_00014g037360 [Physcia stellaris]|nr:hypothetical protein G7Y79_00014g037360 [Physcia stellaris]